MQTFQSFKAQFRGDLITPDHVDYKKAIARWACNAERRAQIVAYVKEPSDVVLALAYAKEKKLPIALHCGGHSALGSSSSEDGLVIDLSRYFNTARVDPKARLVYVGGGAIWETVEKAAIEHGLVTIAGSVSHTGVMGLLLGGGFGWLSGLHGLAVDNFVQATMVVADGRILTASESENQDLFWAIRGGGSNFGVCIEAVLRLHPQRRTIYTGPAIYSPDVLDELVARTEKWWSKGISGKEAMLQVFGPGPNGKPAIIIMFMYNGSEQEGRANFKEFLDLKPLVDQTGEIPYERLNTLQNEFVGHGAGRYMKGIFFKYPDLPSIKKAFDRIIELSTSEVHGNFILEYISTDKVAEVPKDAMAFFQRGAANSISGWTWKNNTPENVEYARSAGREVARLLADGQSHGKGAAQGYGNYDHDTLHVEGEEYISQDKAAELFGDNYPRLQRIKKEYDPEMIFNKWFPIVPA